MSNLAKACIIGTAVVAAVFATSVLVNNAPVNFLLGMAYGALGVTWSEVWEN